MSFIDHLSFMTQIQNLNTTITKSCLVMHSILSSCVIKCKQPYFNVMTLHVICSQSGKIPNRTCLQHTILWKYILIYKAQGDFEMSRCDIFCKQENLSGQTVIRIVIDINIIKHSLSVTTNVDVCVSSFFFVVVCKKKNLILSVWNFKSSTWRFYR